MADFEAQVRAVLDTSQLESSLKSLENTQLKLKNIKPDTSALKDSLQTAIDNTKFTLKIGTVEFSNAANIGKQLGNTVGTSLSDRISKQLNNGGMDAAIARVKAQMEQLGGSTKLSGINDQIKQLSNLKVKIETDIDNGNIEHAVSSYNEFNNTLATVKNSLSIVSSESKQFASSLQITTLDNKMKQWLDQNKNASEEYRAVVERLKAELSEFTSDGARKLDTSQYQRIATDFKKIESSAKAAGTANKSFASSLTGAVKQLTGFYSAVQVLRQGIQLIKSMAKEVVAVDTAMTSLRRVTDLTEAGYTQLYSKMIDSAKQYGATLTDIIDSTTTWVKLGFEADVAQQLGNVTTMYQHVADLDTDTAVKNLVTAYKGFEGQLLELTGGDSAAAVEYVADIFDKLNNEFAVTAAGIGQGLTNCASALQVAGNSIQESAAMLTGITEVTQNSSKAGAALRMLSMRLRGTTAKELEEIGEDSEGVIEVTAKLQKTIKDLSGVDITDVNGQLRSTYDIMDDLASVWDTLSSNQQANVLETIAGKNRASDVAALIRNWDQVRAAFEASNNAWGTASKEQGIYVDSIKGKLDQLKASWQAFANDFISSDFVKFGVDSLSGIVNVLDKLVNTFGTFGTIGIGTTLFSAFKSGIPAIKGVVNEISILGPSLTTIGEKASYAFKSLGGSLSSFIKTPLGVATALGVVATAVGLVTSAYTNYKQAQSEARQKTIEESNAQLEKASAFEAAYVAIHKYIGQDDLSESQESEFAAAVQTCSGALDGKTISLNSAADAQQRYLDTLEDATQKELEAAQTAAKQASKAAEDELADAAWDFWGGSQVTIDLSGRTGVKEFTDALEVAKEVMGDFIDEGRNGIELEPINWDADHKDMEALTDYYYQLINLRDRLTNEDMMDNDIYKDVNSTINSLQPNVEQYVEAKKNELAATQLVTNGIPKTVEEYIAMRDAIVSSIDASDEYKQAISDSLDADYSDIFDIDGYEAQLEKFKAVKKNFADTAIKMNPKDIAAGKEQFDSIMSWYDSLSDEMKEVVYNIVINPDIDTSNFTLEDWIKSISTGAKEQFGFSFSDLVKDKDFDEQVKAYEEKAEKYVEARKKLEEAKGKDKDTFDSVANEIKRDFPEIISGGGDIESDLDNALNKINTDMAAAFESQRPYITEGIEQFDEYKESVLAAGDASQTLSQVRFDNFKDGMSKVSSAADLIKTANEEIAKDGKNSLDTIESLSDLIGEGYGEYISKTVNGDNIIDVKSLRDNFHAAIDELEGDESTKIQMHAEIDAAFDKESEFETLTSLMDEVDKASELIKTANKEAMTTGRNSFETIQSLMSLTGKNYADYLTDDNLIDTEKIAREYKQKIEDGVSNEEIALKLNAKLDGTVDITSFEDTYQEAMNKVNKLNEALVKINGGEELTAEEKINLEFEFPNLRGKSDFKAAIEDEIGIIREGYKELPKTVQEAYDEYQTELDRFRSDTGYNSPSEMPTVFGNIDTDKRAILEWTDETLATYKKAIQSWDEEAVSSWDEVAESMKGGFSTVMGTSGNYDGIEIAFSPMLQTENGAVLLDANTVDEYIFGLLDKACEGDGQWTTEELFNLDLEGLEINGQHIHGLLAAVGDDAMNVASAMHYLGEDGSLATLQRNLESVALSAGMSMDDLNAYLNGEQGGILGLLDQLEASGVDPTWIEAWKAGFLEMCDAANQGTDAVESFSKALSRVNTLSDALEKARSGEEMGVMDVLETAANLAKENGGSIMDYMTGGADGYRLNDFNIDLARSNAILNMPDLDDETKSNVLALKRQEEAYDSLQNTMARVGKASSLIKDANEEITKSGKNSLDSISSLMDLYGQDWAQYVNASADGKGFTIDTKAIKQNMLSAIDEIQGATPELKQSLKDSLEIEFDSSVFTDSVDSYVSDLNTLSDALSKIRSGDFTSSDIYNLVSQFPQLAGSLDDLDGGIRNLMSTMGSDIIGKFKERLNDPNLTEQARAQIEGLMQVILQLQKEATNVTISIDIEAEKTGIETVTNAISESLSATGLSADSVKKLTERYKGLDNANVDELFAKTTHGIMLNTEALADLEKSYSDQNISEIDSQLQRLITQYQLLSEEIQETTDVEKQVELTGQLNQIASQIDQVSSLASEYRALTSDYNQWMEALNTPNQDEAFNNAVDGFEKMKELFKVGKVGTDDFIQGLEYFTGKDFTWSSTSEKVDAYNSGKKTWERYMKGGKDGNQGAQNFLKDLEKNGYATLLDDGSYKIDTNDIDALAESLGIGPDFAKDLLSNLNAYDFKIKFDGEFDFKNLEQKAQSAANKLEELGLTDGFKFKLDSRNVDDLNNQIGKAKEIAKEFYQYDEDGNVIGFDLEVEGAEEAQYLLQALIMRRQELEKPAILKVDTSGASTEIQQAVEKVNQFNEAKNKFELENPANGGSGVSTETLSSLKTAAQELNNLPEEVKTKFNIDSSEVQGAIDNIQAAEVPADIKAGDIEKITSAIQNIDPGEIELQTNADTVQQELSAVNEYTIDDKTFTVSVTDNASEQLSSIEQQVTALDGKTVTITTQVQTEGEPTGDGSTPEQSSGSTVTIKYEPDYSAIEGSTPPNPPDGTVKFNADTSAVDAVQPAQKSGTVTFTVNDSAVQSYTAPAKTGKVTYTATMLAWTPPTKTGKVIYTPVMSGGGGALGTAHAFGTASGKAFKSGNWGTKDSGTALMAEVGPELIVRDGRFFTVGDNGAGFFKYKRGDIIFNADQTRELFENGRVLSNNGRGKIAYAEGTAFADGAHGGGGGFWGTGGGSGGSSGKKPSGGSSSSSGSSGKKPSKSGGSSSSSSSKKGKEKIDWIEIAIDRIERAIDSLERIAESAFHTLATRLSYNADEIAATTDEIALQQQAYERYIKEAESVKLKDNLKELVRDGTIDITKYKKKTADLIKEYQEWYRNMPHHVVIHGGVFT